MPELTPIQSQVLAGLLAGGSIAAVAREHKIHRSTIYNWRHDHSAFAYALRDARKRQAIALHDSVQDLSARAYETLGALLTSECEHTRLRTAQAILRAAGQSAAAFTETEPTSAVQALSERVRRRDALGSIAPEDRVLLENPTAAMEYPDRADGPSIDTIRQISTLQAVSNVERAASAAA